MSEYAETFKDKIILINGGVGAIGGNLTRIFARATYRMMRAQIEATQLGGTGLYFAEIEKECLSRDRGRKDSTRARTLFIKKNFLRMLIVMYDNCLD